MSAEPRCKWQSAPICVRCWTKLKGVTTPARVVDAESEECALCLDWTEELPGIFVRLFLPVARSRDGEEEAEGS